MVRFRNIPRYKHIIVIDETSRRSEDYKLRVESLEQQIRADKRFLTEQAGEREGEREEFNRKIDHLQDIIRRKEKEEDAKFSLLAKKVKDVSLSVIAMYCPGLSCLEHMRLCCILIPPERVFSFCIFFTLL